MVEMTVGKLVGRMELYSADMLDVRKVEESAKRSVVVMVDSLVGQSAVY